MQIIMEAFAFNSKATYRPGVQPDPVKGEPSLIEAHVRVQAVPAMGFVTHFKNVFEKYKLPNISWQALIQYLEYHTHAVLAEPSQFRGVVRHHGVRCQLS